MDEKHPPYPIETYSLSKYIAEVQADSIALANPDMSIATVRFHFVLPTSNRPKLLADNVHKAKDLWGWVSDVAAARACLLGVEMGDARVNAAGESLGPTKGHEVFFIVDDTHCSPGNTAIELAKRHYPSVEFRKELGPEEGFYDCSKAKRLLGWEHNGGIEPTSNW